MAFNGAGVFNRIYNWVNDKNAAIPITASRMDTEDNGFATGLSLCLTKDGQQVAAANLPMGGFKHTNVAIGSSSTDYARLDQLQSNTVAYCGTSSGTDTITAGPTPALGAYATGQVFEFKAGGTNTTAATLNLSALGAKAIQKNGVALVAGDITINDIVEVVYDGTQFQMTSPARTPVITAQGISGLAITNNTIPAAALLSTIVHDLTAKTTLVGADEIMISDSAASNAAKKITYTNFLAARPVTTKQYLTSGSAATYTTPANCKAILVKAVGGGGGGGAIITNAGGTGGTTIFNSVNAIGGGGGGIYSGTTGKGGTGGTGGTGSATFRIAGGDGGSLGTFVASTVISGANGGTSVLGGAGRGGLSSEAGQPGKTNTGGGGGGASGSGSGSNGGAAGGGAGEYFELYIASPSATYTYTIGSAGTGGAAGTFAGGAGGTGMIIVEEYY